MAAPAPNDLATSFRTEPKFSGVLGESLGIRAWFDRLAHKRDSYPGNDAAYIRFLVSFWAGPAAAWYHQARSLKEPGDPVDWNRFDNDFEYMQEQSLARFEPDRSLVQNIPDVAPLVQGPKESIADYRQRQAGAVSTNVEAIREAAMKDIPQTEAAWTEWLRELAPPNNVLASITAWRTVLQDDEADNDAKRDARAGLWLAKQGAISASAAFKNKVIYNKASQQLAKGLRDKDLQRYADEERWKHTNLYALATAIQKRTNQKSGSATTLKEQARIFESLGYIPPAAVSAIEDSGTFGDGTEDAIGRLTQEIAALRSQVHSRPAPANGAGGSGTSNKKGNNNKNNNKDKKKKFKRLPLDQVTKDGCTHCLTNGHPEKACWQKKRWQQKLLAEQNASAADDGDEEHQAHMVDIQHLSGN